MSFGQVPEPLNKRMSGAVASTKTSAQSHRGLLHGVPADCHQIVSAPQGAAGSGNHADRVAAGNEALLPGAD